MNRTFLIENLDAAIAAVTAHPAGRLNLSRYRQELECGTLYCTAGLLAVTPHFMERGWSALAHNGEPTIEGQDLGYMSNEHLGPDAWTRLFAPAYQGDWDAELIGEESITDKELALRRLRKQRDYVMENLE